MKRRVVFILLFVIIGIILITIFIKPEESVNYLELDYEIIYNEDEKNNSALLMNTRYYDYIFTNYDENSYVLFSNNEKFGIKEALEKNYLFLGDLLKEINITKEYSFNLQATFNKEQELERKLRIESKNIYYYKINDIQVITKTKENLLELLNENILGLEDILQFTAENGTINEKENYKEYTMDDIKIIVNEDNIYFGNMDLNKTLIQDFKEGAKR